MQAALCPQGEKYPILPGVRRTKDPPQQARVGGPEQGQTLEKAAAEKAGFPGLFSGKTGAGNHFPRQPTKRIYFFYFSIQTTPARDGVSRLYGDNVFEKDGIRRDRTGDGEKTRCLCGKRGIFNRDGPAMGPQIIRQLE